MPGAKLRRALPVAAFAPLDLASMKVRGEVYLVGAAMCLVHEARASTDG